MSASTRARPPSPPRKATARIPSLRAASSPWRMLGEFPGREGDGHVASPAQGLHLSRKDSFIRGVVRNAGQRRSIGAESESSQRGTIPGHSIHQLRCQVLGFGGTATVSEEEGLASSGERLGDFAGRAQDSLFVHGKELPHGSL